MLGELYNPRHTKNAVLEEEAASRGAQLHWQLTHQQLKRLFASPVNSESKASITSHLQMLACCNQSEVWATSGLIKVLLHGCYDYCAKQFTWQGKNFVYGTKLLETKHTLATEVKCRIVECASVTATCHHLKPEKLQTTWGQHEGMLVWKMPVQKILRNAFPGLPQVTNY